MRFSTGILLLVLLSGACFAQTVAIPSTAKTVSTCWDPAVIGQVPTESPASELRNIKPNHGVIKIEVLVNPDGQIGAIKWIDGPDIFSKPVITWVKGCLYIPASAGEQQV